MNDEEMFRRLPAGKLFARLVIPGLFSMLFSSLYAVADGIFVGRFLGSSALAAVNVVFPFLAVTYAVGDMIAVGSGVKISMALGKRSLQQASRIFSGSMLMIFLLSLFFQAAVLLFFADWVHCFIRDGELAALACRYMEAYAYTLPITTQLYCLDNYLRICGRIKYCMWVNILVSCMNILLDGVFIGLLGGGIESAAWASAVSMCIGTFLSLYPFVRGRTNLHFIFPRVYFRELWEIVYNGSSECLNKLSYSGISILFNCLLLKYGGAPAVAAYAAVLYIEHILFSVNVGILDAVQPAVSYNFGAGDRARTFRMVNTASGWIAAVSFCFLFICWAASDTLIGIFILPSDSDAFREAGIALMFYLPGFGWNWINSAVSSFATDFARSGESLVVMTLKTVIFPLILAGILPPLLGTVGIYMIPAVGGGLCCIVSLCIWHKIRVELRAVQDC